MSYPQEYYETYNGEYDNGYHPHEYYNSDSGFMQFSEEMTKDSFTKMENFVKTIMGFSTMFENIFMTATVSFDTIMSVAKQCSKLNSTAREQFGRIWNTVSILKFLMRSYVKLKELLGFKLRAGEQNEIAWDEAIAEINKTNTTSISIPWEVIGFVVVLMTAPYYYNKFFLKKYEDRMNPDKWTCNGYEVEAMYSFEAAASNQMSFEANDKFLIAPKYIQKEMKLHCDTSWAFAVGNGRAGIIPINFVKFLKNKKKTVTEVEENSE